MEQEVSMNKGIKKKQVEKAGFVGIGQKEGHTRQ